MKSRYIFPAVIAAVAMFASCSEKENLYLDNLQVSTSYIAISPEGGEVTVDVTATEAWTMDFDVNVIGKKLDKVKGIVNDTTQVKQLDIDDNSWFTASVREGGKGKTTVKFSAEATTASRTSNITIKAGDKVQNLVVAQKVTSSGVEITPIADVLAGPEKTYRVKGYCSIISNTTYGNWYMSDGNGNTLYIYGTVDASGSYNWSSFNIALGDEVTVEGIKVVYGSTIELKDATFISVKKALLASDDASKYISKGAETFTIKVAQKGESLSFESQADWLTFEGNGYTSDGKGNLTFTVKATENTTGASREGTLVFKSAKGSDETELPVTIIQMGTEPVKSNLGAISETLSRATSKAPASFDVTLESDARVTYKNGNNFFLEDAKGCLLVYSSDVNLKVGQVVKGRVWGKGYAYNNLPEATAFNLQFATVTTSEDPVEPTEVSLAEICDNYGSYLNRYVKIKGLTVAEAIDIDYETVTSSGKITDGNYTLALNHQSTGKFNGNKIWYYVQAAAGSKIDLVCIPSVNKSGNQLNVYAQSWITASE